MIQVQLEKKGQLVLGFTFRGHAEAGEYGYDIVCSAVSALAISTANAIEQLTEAAFDEDAAQDGGFLRFRLRSGEDHDAQVLMKALELGISQMAASYPDNIRIVTTF